MPKVDRRILLMVPTLLAIVVAAVYARALGNGFQLQWDDMGYVKNPYVRDGLSLGVVKWAFTSMYFANWSPLTFISHALDVSLFGFKPAGHHAVNVLLHVINGLLLLAVLVRMTGALWRSALVAALFGLHPLHVESVAWISERKDVLSTMFWLLTMLAYVRFARRGGVGAYVLVALCLMLGLMAKSMLVTMPFVLLLLDFWPLQRLTSPAISPASNDHNADGIPRVTLRRAIIEKVPLLAICLIAAVLTVIAQREGQAVQDFTQVPLLSRLGNAALAYIAYLRLTIWPAGLAAFYPMRQPLPVAGVVASFLTIMMATVLAAQRARAKPYLIVGWLWFMGTLVPVIGLVQVGAQSMADRYTYVPLIGLFIAVSWGIGEIASRWPMFSPQRSAIILGCFVALIACGVVTSNQIALWADSETLFKAALRVTPDNTVVRNILGGDYRSQGRLSEASDQFQRALELDAGNLPALNGMGTLMMLQDRPNDALPWFRKALEVAPHDPRSRLNVASALALAGALEEAQSNLTASLAAEPDNPDALVLQGQIAGAQGRLEQAILHYEAALRAKPDVLDAHVYAADALIRLGRPDQARKHLEAALRLAPDDPKAQALLKTIGH